MFGPRNVIGAIMLVPGLPFISNYRRGPTHVGMGVVLKTTF